MGNEKMLFLVKNMKEKGEKNSKKKGLKSSERVFLSHHLVEELLNLLTAGWHDKSLPPPAGNLIPFLCERRGTVTNGL